MSVMSACHVFILLHCVSWCSVVFLYSLSGTFCLPVLTSGPFFQSEALFLHLYLRHCPLLYQGFVLVFYIESLSSYLWGFVLIFYFEASFSYFIWSLCPHICYRGFVLIFDLRFHPHGYILRWCSSVWDFGPHCCRPLLVCLQWFVCGSVCLYFCLG